MKIPGIVPAEQITNDMVELLKKEATEAAGITNYPARLQQRFRRSIVAKGLAEVAEFVEPVDRTLGIDKESGVARAFYIGELLGLRVTAACVENVDAAFSNLPLIPEFEVDPEDRLHSRQLLANEIINMGSEGYAKVDTMFDPLLEEWEGKLVPEVRNQRYMRIGFGIPVVYLYARYEANLEADMAAMEKEITAQGSDGFDWDSLLR